MAYIPKDAEWYIAELVNEITVEGEVTNVVHRDLVLIHAESPEDAYRKALELGRASESSYENPEGKNVLTKFRGMADLNVIHDRLEHGAELIYTEDTNVPSERILGWLRDKSELGVFRTITATVLSNHPDYSSKEIVEQVDEILRKAR